MDAWDGENPLDAWPRAPPDLLLPDWLSRQPTPFQRPQTPAGPAEPRPITPAEPRPSMQPPARRPITPAEPRPSVQPPARRPDMQLGRVRPAEPEEPEPRARRPPAPKAPSLPAVSEPSRLVCRARYAAVDRAGHGLIDLGMDSYGARILLVHRRGGISLSTGDSLDFKGATTSGKLSGSGAFVF